MADKIQIKRSTVADKKPTPEQLAEGELALNLQDEKIYAKNADGVVKEFPKAASVDVGVESVNDITGEVDINGSDNVSVTKSGQNLTLDVKDTVALKTDVPAQVNLIEGDGIEITGTYPNQTITNEVTDLGDLSSVTIDGNAGIADDSVLTWNGTAWVPGTGGGSSDVENLPDLGDVTFPTDPVTGQILQYSDGKWKNVDVSAADGRTTVNTLGGAVTIKGTSPISVASPNPNDDNEIIIGYTGTSGGKETLAELTDTTIATPEEDQFLRWSGDTGTGKWVNETVTLSSAPNDAQKNVQSDWNATEGDALILNKPTLAPGDAEKNVQSDWNEATTSADAYIKNKPTIPTNTDTGIVKLTHGELSVTGGADREVTFKSSDASVQFALNASNEIDFTVPLAGLNIKGVVQYALPQTQADGRITVNGTEYEVLWDPATYLDDVQSGVVGAALGDLWIIQYKGSAIDEGTVADGNGYVYSLDENGVAEWSLVGPIQGPPGENGSSFLPISSTDDKVTLSDDGNGKFQIETGSTEESKKARVVVDEKGRFLVGDNAGDNVNFDFHFRKATQSQFVIETDAGMPQLKLKADDFWYYFSLNPDDDNFRLVSYNGTNAESFNIFAAQPNGDMQFGQNVIVLGQVQAPKYTTEDAAVNDCWFRANGDTFEVFTGNSGEDNTTEKSLVGTHGNWALGLPASGNIQPSSATTLKVQEDYKTTSSNYLGIDCSLNVPEAVNGWCYAVKAEVASMSDGTGAVYNFVGSRPVRDTELRTVQNGNDVQVDTYTSFMVWSAINSRSKHNSAWKSGFNTQTYPAVGFFGEYETVQVPNPDYIDDETTPGVPPTIDQVNEIQPPDPDFAEDQRVIVKGEIASTDDLPLISYNTESIVDGETVVVPPPPGSPVNGDAYTLNTGDQSGRVYCLTGFDPAIADSGDWTFGVVPEFTYDNWNIDVQGNAPSRFYGNICTRKIGAYSNSPDDSSITFSGGQMRFDHENQSYWKCTEDSTTNALYFYDAIDQNTWNGGFVTYTSAGDAEPRTAFDLGKNSALVWASRGNLGLCSATSEVRIGVSTAKTQDQQLTVTKNFIKSSVPIRTDTITDKDGVGVSIGLGSSVNSVFIDSKSGFIGSGIRMEVNQKTAGSNVTNFDGFLTIADTSAGSLVTTMSGSRVSMRNTGVGAEVNQVFGYYAYEMPAASTLTGENPISAGLRLTNNNTGAGNWNILADGTAPSKFWGPIEYSSSDLITDDDHLVTKSWVLANTGSGGFPIVSETVGRVEIQADDGDGTLTFYAACTLGNADADKTVADNGVYTWYANGEPDFPPPYGSPGAPALVITQQGVLETASGTLKNGRTDLTGMVTGFGLEGIRNSVFYPHVQRAHDSRGNGDTGLEWDEVNYHFMRERNALDNMGASLCGGLTGDNTSQGCVKDRSLFTIREGGLDGSVHITTSADYTPIDDFDILTKKYFDDNRVPLPNPDVPIPPVGSGAGYTWDQLERTPGLYLSGVYGIDGIYSIIGFSDMQAGTTSNGINMDLMCYWSTDGRTWTEGFVGGNWVAGEQNSSLYEIPTPNNAYGKYCDGTQVIFTGNAFTSTGKTWQGYNCDNAGQFGTDRFIGNGVPIYWDSGIEADQAVDPNTGIYPGTTWPEGPVWITSRLYAIEDLEDDDVNGMVNISSSAVTTQTDVQLTNSRDVTCPKVFFSAGGNDDYYRSQPTMYKPLQSEAVIRQANKTDTLSTYFAVLSGLMEYADACCSPDGKTVLALDSADNQFYWFVHKRTTLTVPSGLWQATGLCCAYDRSRGYFAAATSDTVRVYEAPYTSGTYAYGGRLIATYTIPQAAEWTHLSISGGVYLLMSKSGAIARLDTNNPANTTFEMMGANSPAVFSANPVLAGTNGRFLITGGEDVNGLPDFGTSYGHPLSELPTDPAEDQRYAWSGGDNDPGAQTTTGDIDLTNPEDPNFFTAVEREEGRKSTAPRALLTTQEDANQYFAEEIAENAGLATDAMGVGVAAMAAASSNSQAILEKTTVVTLTQAEYDALGADVKQDVLYLITV